jgi:hypothetical protein
MLRDHQVQRQEISIFRRALTWQSAAYLTRRPRRAHSQIRARSRAKIRPVFGVNHDLVVVPGLDGGDEPALAQMADLDLAAPALRRRGSWAIRGPVGQMGGGILGGAARVELASSA